MAADLGSGWRRAGAQLLLSGVLVLALLAVLAVIDVSLGRGPTVVLAVLGVLLLGNGTAAMAVSTPMRPPRAAVVDEAPSPPR